MRELKHLRDLKPEDLPTPRPEHPRSNYKVMLRRSGIDYRGSGETYTRTAEQAIAIAKRLTDKASSYAKPRTVAIAARRNDYPRGRSNFPVASASEGVIIVDAREEQ